MERGKYFLSNHRARVYLDVIAGISGKHGFAKVLQLAGLHIWFEGLPPYNNAREVDFADFSALNTMLLKMYGPRAGQAMALRAGRASFLALTPHLTDVLNAQDVTFKGQSPAQRIKAVLETITNDTPTGEVHTTFQVAGEQFIYAADPCPFCWGQNHSPEAMCHGLVGFLQQAVEWVGAGDDYRVEEASCAAVKEPKGTSCVFVILKVD
jgi:predicted hydrocarbon binding protein